MPEDDVDGRTRSLQAVWGAMRKTREDNSPAGMISALYGSTSRGRPDTRAAAAALGVSQRTVQRWVKEGLPASSRSGGAERLAAGHQQWKNSADGRRAQLSPRRESRLRNQGTSMVFFGKIAVSSDPRNQVRRSTTIDISGESMGRILDAALRGDDLGAHDALEDAFGEAFGGSVSLEITSAETYR